MGNSKSSIIKELPASWLEMFHAILLTDGEVKKLHKVFRTLDLTKDGIVQVSDLLTMVDIERTCFTERIFAVFDSNKSGAVDFREFVMSLWNYCTLGKASLSKSQPALHFSSYFPTL